jgi:hypothetical protein
MELNEKTVQMDGLPFGDAASFIAERGGMPHRFVYYYFPYRHHLLMQRIAIRDRLLPVHVQYRIKIYSCQ